MSIQNIIAASQSSGISPTFILIVIALVVIAYIWSILDQRKSLKAECAKQRQSLAQANQEISNLQREARDARSATEEHFSKSLKAECAKQRQSLAQANQEISNLQRQARDARSATEEHFRQQQNELERNASDLERRADDRAQTYARELAAKEEELTAAKALLDSQNLEARAIHQEWIREIDAMQQRFEDIHLAFGRNFSDGRRWLAKAYTDLLRHHDERHEWSLALTARTGTKVAAELAAAKLQRRQLSEQVHLLKWQIASYEEYFPALADYRDAILDEAIDLRTNSTEGLEKADPALSKGYLTRQEFDSLDRVTRFQLALDRYKSRGKSSWEVGRDYERQIGHQHEISGWRVEYHGALQGFEDLGRDLICQQNDEMLIVQCKCWREDRPIRERHVFQLYGTSVLRRMEVSASNTAVRPILVTTGCLSDIATRAAQALGISVIKIPRRDYPLIKCNVNSTTRERIYHLPFDQQYDRIVIGDQPGEQYVWTVAEAERLGFRRAYRWSGTA
jgi:hypothetical protein